MKTILRAMLILLLCNNIANGQCKLDYTNYQLVLNEQFDTYNGQVSNLLGANSIWKAQPDNVYSGWDIEYYLPSQVQLISDSTGGYRLRLNAEKVTTGTTPLVLPNGRPVHYKSGMLTLKDATSLPNTISFDPLTNSCPYPNNNQRGFAYGMFEIRCKMADGSPTFWDTWPAFWLLSVGAELDLIDDITPNPGEDYLSGLNDWSKLPWHPANTNWVQVSYCSTCPAFDREANYNTGAIISESWGVSYQAVHPVTGMVCGALYKSKYRNLSNTFTKYTAVWTPDKITFFVEGKEIYTINKTLAKLTSECPLNILTTLQIFSSAKEKPLGQKYNWDIDYIKVYKPIGNNYNLSFKSNTEYISHDIFDGNTTAPTNVSPYANAIATNTNNPNEVFYRGTDNYIYRSIKINGTWQTSRIWLDELNLPLVAGDIKYVPQNDILLYVGTDERINLIYRSTYDPSEFYHWHLTSNWNCYTCVTNDLISTASGSLNVSSSGEVFFRGKDNKIHRYKYVSGSWQHQILYNPDATAKYVKGDIVIDPNVNNIFFKGNDNRIQILYPNTSGVYQHSWVDDNWSTSNYLVNTQAGSMSWAASLNGILYIGTDNKIHLFSWNQTWQHQWLPYTYGNTPINYLNGDYAKSSLAWDNNLQKLYYLGYDGRIQMFYKTGTNWYHNWVDDNWNNNDFMSYNNSTSILFKSSTALNNEMPDKSIYYTKSNGHLAYFKYESCENSLTSCTNNPPKNIFRTGRNTFADETIAKTNFKVYPNPAKDFLTINANDNNIPYNITISDMNGNILMNNANFIPVIDKINIEYIPVGLYIITLKTEYIYQYSKFIKIN